MADGAAEGCRVSVAAHQESGPQPVDLSSIVEAQVFDLQLSSGRAARAVLKVTIDNRLGMAAVGLIRGGITTWSQHSARGRRDPDAPLVARNGRLVHQTSQVTGQSEEAGITIVVLADRAPGEVPSGR